MYVVGADVVHGGMFIPYLVYSLSRLEGGLFVTCFVGEEVREEEGDQYMSSQMNQGQRNQGTRGPEASRADSGPRGPFNFRGV
jgi:hypothetical protein